MSYLIREAAEQAWEKAVAAHPDQRVLSVNGDHPDWWIEVQDTPPRTLLPPRSEGPRYLCAVRDMSQPTLAQYPMPGYWSVVDGNLPEGLDAFRLDRPDVDVPYSAEGDLLFKDGQSGEARWVLIYT